jgi:FkbM family methyltransferase
MKTETFYKYQLSPDRSIHSVNFITWQVARILRKLRPAFFASFLKRILRLNRKNIVTPEGVFYIDLSSNLGSQLFTAGIYEPCMLQVLKTYLQPGGVFVDLGANEGYFSVIASKILGNAGKVIAIEPQSRLQSVISKNLSLNDCENVNVLPLAVSDKSESITLLLSPDINTGSTSVIQTTRYPLSQEKVPGATLTEIFREQAITNCDLLKLDIEGYEYEAIMGSPELFTSHQVKVIALEFHPQQLAKRGLSCKPIKDFLGSCGYTLSPLFENPVFIISDN